MSYQNSWPILLPPWLHSRGPGRGAGPAGFPGQTSSAPAGQRHSGRRYRLPRLRRGSHLEDKRARSGLSQMHVTFTFSRLLRVQVEMFSGRTECDRESFIFRFLGWNSKKKSKKITLYFLGLLILRSQLATKANNSSDTGNNQPNCATLFKSRHGRQKPTFLHWDIHLGDKTKVQKHSGLCCVTFF